MERICVKRTCFGYWRTFFTMSRTCRAHKQYYNVFLFAFLFLFNRLIHWHDHWNWLDMLDLIVCRINWSTKAFKMASHSISCALVRIHQAILVCALENHYRYQSIDFIMKYWSRSNAGETGLGKSTLMDTLFNTSFESAPSPHTLPNVKLKSNTYELQESSVRLKLTICDTVGYGDQINKDDSFKAVVDYIDAQFEAYLQEELKIKRSLSTCHDSRIHICLYFICPTGHGLKSLDLVCMKKLDTKVNIIPIIAKADTISKTELQRFKVRSIDILLLKWMQYELPLFVSGENYSGVDHERCTNLSISHRRWISLGGEHIDEYSCAICCCWQHWIRSIGQ